MSDDTERSKSVTGWDVVDWLFPKIVLFTIGFATGAVVV
jgi:hypothetical protein